MAVILNVNTDANIILTAKLERLNRSAFPSAVRSTLNDASFAMKQTNILASAKMNMTVRNLSIFKKFTGVKRAAGFNVSSMYSMVGFVSVGGTSGNKIPEGMERNEVGGVDNSGAMYSAKSRTSNSLKKKVRIANRFDKSKMARSGRSSNIKSKKEGFMSRILASLHDNAPVMIKTSKGTFVVKVNSVTPGRGDKKVDVKMDFLMRGRRKSPAKTKATHFNREAAIFTSKQMDVFYEKNATFQFNKVLMGKK
ncbi:hypothetical protein [Flavobacterium phage FL-1]|nr:hypothetical protein [Flavobacterium phage FL-1]